MHYIQCANFDNAKESHAKHAVPLKCCTSEKFSEQIIQVKALVEKQEFGFKKSLALKANEVAVHIH